MCLKEAAGVVKQILLCNALVLSTDELKGFPEKDSFGGISSHKYAHTYFMISLLFCDYKPSSSPECEPQEYHEFTQDQ